jgi:hypothetical protein
MTDEFVMAIFAGLVGCSLVARLFLVVLHCTVLYMRYCVKMKFLDQKRTIGLEHILLYLLRMAVPGTPEYLLRYMMSADISSASRSMYDEFRCALSSPFPLISNLKLLIAISNLF